MGDSESRGPALIGGSIVVLAVAAAAIVYQVRASQPAVPASTMTKDEIARAAFAGAPVETPRAKSAPAVAPGDGLGARGNGRAALPPPKK